MKPSMMSRACTSMMSSVFTFLRSCFVSFVRTCAASSLSCCVSLTSRFFSAYLLPLATRRKTSSVSHVHQICEPTSPTMPSLLLSQSLRFSCAYAYTPSLVIWRSEMTICCSTVVIHVSTGPSIAAPVSIRS